jgi:hypothetical protein
VNLPRLGVSGDGGIGLTVYQILHHGLRPALPHAADLHGAGTDDLAGKPCQIGLHTLLKHGTQLPGRSRQQHHLGASELQDHPGSGAVVVLQGNSPLRQHGLLPVVRRGLHAFGGKISLNGLPALLMHLQMPSADPGRRLLGQIVLRGPQAAGQNHNVGALHGCPKHLGETLLIVPHHCLKITGKAQPRAFLRQVGRIGIYDISQKKLCSYTYQFNCHTLLISVRPSQPSFSPGNPPGIPPSAPGQST